MPKYVRKPPGKAATPRWLHAHHHGTSQVKCVRKYSRVLPFSAHLSTMGHCAFLNRFFWYRPAVCGTYRANLGFTAM